MSLRIIGIDADDTLWHTETVFRLTHKRFNELLGEFAGEDELEAKLAAIERENMKAFGYGAKGFTLSMIQTAIEVSDGAVSPKVIGELLQAGKEMMTHPIEPLPGVEEALKVLAGRAQLVLITKGDLFHQESKLAASGLGSHFSGVEIVSEKTPEIYARAFARHGAPAETRDDGGEFGEVGRPADAEGRRVCGADPLPAGVGARAGGEAGWPSALPRDGDAGAPARLAERDHLGKTPRPVGRGVHVSAFSSDQFGVAGGVAGAAGAGRGGGGGALGSAWPRPTTSPDATTWPFIGAISSS